MRHHKMHIKKSGVMKLTPDFFIYKTFGSM